MPIFQAKVEVNLRPSVLDPAGEAAKSASLRLGIEGVNKLRIGKSIMIEIDASTEDEANKSIQLLCDRLLSNPVIEKWSFELNRIPIESQVSL